MAFNLGNTPLNPYYGTGQAYNQMTFPGSNQNQYSYQPASFTPPQPPAPSMLVGRIVNDISDIRPNETPTTGQCAVFPKSDGSVVYLTYMDNTGRIITSEYIPKEAPKEQPANNETIDSMREQLNRIEKMLSDLT